MAVGWGMGLSSNVKGENTENILLLKALAVVKILLCLDDSDSSMAG